jgi:hypothetical protein
MIINEDLLYYIWQFKKFDHRSVLTTSGVAVDIVHYGQRNVSSGPDFSNGKIKINDILWAGNIEMHVKTSDWLKHKHQNDDAYKNVILHVVYEHDKDINDIPTLELKNLIDPALIDKFSQLMEGIQWIPCELSLPYIDKSKFKLWSNGLAIERLENKVEVLAKSEAFKAQDWVQLLYERIARYFGATQNSDVFESLAKMLPYNLIIKNKFDPKIIETLVFGCAGFLEEDAKDAYHHELINEYQHQKIKYKISAINKVEWKSFGMFASGTPNFRLAQFSSFISKIDISIEALLQMNSPKDIEKLFFIELPLYWQNHYSFGKPTSAIKGYPLSNDLVQRIIINAIVPTLFAYSKETGKDDIISYVLDLLDLCKVEDNSVIKKWKGYGFKSENAVDSQALLHLKNEYCDKRKCLYCPIGRDVLNLK